MTDAREATLRERFERMDDAELRRALTLDRDTYTPRALAIADAELARRSAKGYRDAAPPLSDAPSPDPPRLLWADVYASLAGMAAIGEVFGAAVDASPPELSFKIALACLTLLLALGLKRRRRWAWQANWIFLARLALLVVYGRSEPAEVQVLLWWIPIFFVGRYFHEHRTHFGVAS